GSSDLTRRYCPTAVLVPTPPARRRPATQRPRTTAARLERAPATGTPTRSPAGCRSRPLLGRRPRPVRRKPPECVLPEARRRRPSPVAARTKPRPVEIGLEENRRIGKMTRDPPWSQRCAHLTKEGLV